MHDSYDKVIFEGVEYQIVSVLGNDLLLVVVDQDLQEGKFPLQTYIIPDNRFK